MCLSPSYEYDKLSQFEAELAVRLGKPYILVNVQAKYVPDYWLESIVDGRNVVSFGLATAKNDMLFIVDEIDSKIRGIRGVGGGRGAPPNRATNGNSLMPTRAKSAFFSRSAPNASAAAAPPRTAYSKLCTILWVYFNLAITCFLAKYGK